MKEGEKNTDKKEVEKIIQGHFIRYFFEFYNLNLNSDEIHVLNIICSFELDNKTYTGSQKYLCTLLKISKPRALRILNQLIKKGYLIKEASKGKQSSIYKINFTFLKEQLLNSAKTAQLKANYGEIPQLGAKTNCNDLLQSKSQNCNDLLHQLSQNITVNCNKTLHNKNNNKNINKNNIYSQSEIDTVSFSQEDNNSNTKKEADTKVPTSEKKKNTSSKKEQEEKYLEMFNEFWKLYPKKVDKANARKKWLRLKPNDELFKTIMSALENQITFKKWHEIDKQYIPNPTTWINGERWEDEIKEAEGNSQPLNTLSKSDKTICLPAKDELTQS